MLGDVEGHGAEAAALTAMVRYTIRTAAMLEGDLLAALEILNEELRSRERPRLCSVVCVSFGIDAEATVISAGHPLPLLVSGGTIREVGLPGSLLGALEEPQWSPVRFEVERGDELVVYTDGVIEARHELGSGLGVERLGSLLRRMGEPGDAVKRVGDAIDAFAETIQDDAAMLVLRRERPAESRATVGGSRHARNGREDRMIAALGFGSSWLGSRASDPSDCGVAVHVRNTSGPSALKSDPFVRTRHENRNLAGRARVALLAAGDGGKRRRSCATPLAAWPRPSGWTRSPSPT